LRGTDLDSPVSKTPKVPKDAGYTMIELMVTVTCMIVLSAIAFPSLKGYIRQANLQDAKPYLMEIAAKQRMYKAVNGVYCCSNYDGSTESQLLTALGLSLADAGDFCFLFVCNSATLCSSTAGGPSGFISGNPSKDTAPDFEVWAVLNNAAAAVNGPGGSNCKPAPNKVPPTGWVASSTSGLAGSAGQVVAFRYPPPPNGASTGTGSFHTAVTFNWQAGVSLSDAMFP
jgi:type II secretory pathway pseudopilin PulG